MPDHEIVNPEELGYWFLRLNGCMTISNFVVHPDIGSNQRTDIDVLGVRFPFRYELPQMQDDAFFAQCKDKPLLVVTEIKTGDCVLNDSLLNSQNETLSRVLSAAGMFSKEESILAAKSLQETGQYDCQLYRVFLVVIGSSRNVDLAARMPKVQQFEWSHVLKFIHNRFRTFKKQKRSHPQWDKVGQQLWGVAERHKLVKDFIAAVRVA